MLKIGLTGGIGTGKTTVSRIFEVLGIPVYYADEAARNLYHTNEELKVLLREHFGPDIYQENQLDRKKLAARVFSDPSKLNLLNSLVHPLTIKDAAEWMNRQSGPYAIKEAALLFESGSVAGLDYIIGVTAPRALRIQRVMERDKVERDEVTRRMNNQVEDEIKMKLCDFVILNNEQEAVIPQVLAVHEKIMQLAAERLEPAASNLQ